MSQFFRIHPDNPQPRLIKQAVEIVRQGGVIVYPTDSCYALGCQIGDKQPLDRIRQIRRLPEGHDFTLVCRDLSELANYAKVDNSAFRLLKAATPGAYTFLLPATREVPRRLIHPKKKTIGLRVPDHAILRALLEALGEPMMNTSLILPGEDLPMSDPHEIRERLEHAVDLVVDGGFGGLGVTTMVSLGPEGPKVLRQGLGSDELFRQSA